MEIETTSGRAGDPDELLSTEEAAPLVGVAPDTLKAWRTRRPEHGPAWVEVSARRVKYRRRVLWAWVDERERGGDRETAAA